MNEFNVIPDTYFAVGAAFLYGTGFEASSFHLRFSLKTEPSGDRRGDLSFPDRKTMQMSAVVKQIRRHHLLNEVLLFIDSVLFSGKKGVVS
ncbi:hypothetical protein NA728_20165 [Escherichia coli]|nr:hypothetical protein [Escherichia coli]